MSAYILGLGSVSHEDAKLGTTYHSKVSDGGAGLYAAGHLGTWMLQRQPHQRGLWYVQLHIRGMCVCGYAVQDDFGALQFVEVQ
jgi:hypothetical protein